MEAGFLGRLEQFPNSFERYIVFLPNETQIPLRAETQVIKHFWDAANSTDDSVLFSGIAKGDGLIEAREKFNITEKSEPYFILLDKCPSEWNSMVDPIVKIPVGQFDNEDDVTHLLLSLVTAVSIREVKRKEFFRKAKNVLANLPYGDLISLIIPISQGG